MELWVSLALEAFVMRKRFSNEFAYVMGILFVAMGVVFMEKADFSVSMVVAPAYLLYRSSARFRKKAWLALRAELEYNVLN